MTTKAKATNASRKPAKRTSKPASRKPASTVTDRDASKWTTKAKADALTVSRPGCVDVVFSVNAAGVPGLRIDWPQGQWRVIALN